MTASTSTSCVFSYPGTMEHAQHAALALHEAGALKSFFTNIAFDEQGRLARLLASLPPVIANPVRQELRRRSMPVLPADLIRTRPAGEALRTLLSRAGAGEVLIDRVWDWDIQGFDRACARRHVAGADCVVAFEYSALATFRAAKARGVARVLHLPSLDTKAFNAIQDREKAIWPELRGPNDSYFDATLERRYERRLEEIALADLIIANSSLTARSHIAAGADPAKVVVVPLAAPRAVAEARPPQGGTSGPLTVLWSGPFSLRKGAHYLLQAWREFNPGSAARLCVYGQVTLPERLLADLPDSIEFRGSIPRAAMMDAYGQADILIFPTLSDGFGMAISEALSRGVPVITTDQAGGADLVQPGVNGLIVPAAEPSALVEALTWCADNRAAVAAMREPALGAAKARQWTDYRRDIRQVTDAGLQRAGYASSLELAAS